MSLKQGNLRKLVNLEETINNMLIADRAIDNPAYQYVSHDAMNKELEEFVRKQQERMSNRGVRIRYRTKNQM